MKKWLGFITMIVCLGTAAFADGKKGPEIQVIDNKVSISAEAVGLGRLLRLFDMATGLKSKVPPELANRNISVRFSGLNFDQAVQKIFEGVPLDYVVIHDQGIIVTAASQPASGTAVAASPAFNAVPERSESDEQPFFPGGNGVMGGQGYPPAAGPFPGSGGMNQQPVGMNQGQQGQPAMIQTPFGPIPNPRAQQQPGNMPMATPGGNQPFGLGYPGANPNPNAPTSPFGDGTPPAFNPNPTTPAAPSTNPFGTPYGIPGQPTAPPRKPPGQ